MNCHLPDADELGFWAWMLPPDSRFMTQHGGRLPPHRPLPGALMAAPVCLMGAWARAAAARRAAMARSAAILRSMSARRWFDTEVRNVTWRARRSTEA